MNNKNLSDIIKENYSLDPKSEKWISKGGEILRYIGVPIVLVDYTKKDDEWSSVTKQANIKTIKDFDPMTLTYEITYTVEDDPKEIIERLIPEGYVFNNPEKDLWARRFVPYSLHMQMSEEEALVKRLKNLFDTRDSLPMEQISQIRTNKNSLITNFIAAVIDTNNGLDCGICYFRINEFTMPNFSKKDNTWTFGIKDIEGNYFPMKWNLSENFIKLYSAGKFIGNVKIMDIED